MESSGFENTGLRSHMLLAACSSLQVALESNGRGHFTRALLALLQREDLSMLLYSDIPKLIDPIRQYVNSGHHADNSAS